MQPERRARRYRPLSAAAPRSAGMRVAWTPSAVAPTGPDLPRTRPRMIMAPTVHPPSRRKAGGHLYPSAPTTPSVPVAPSGSAPASTPGFSRLPARSEHSGTAPSHPVPPPPASSRPPIHLVLREPSVLMCSATILVPRNFFCTSPGRFP